MFEKASKLKLRFESTAGYLSVEDLWDLPLTSEKKANLDDIARAISKKIKETETESFVEQKTTADETLKLKLDIVKRIIEVKLAKNKADAEAREKKEQKERILGIIERKKDEQLESASIEDLQKALESL